MPNICIKFDSPVYEELNFLSDTFGISKNAVIRNLIRQEYSRYQDDPVVLDAVTKMVAIREILENKSSE